MMILWQIRVASANISSVCMKTGRPGPTRRIRVHNAPVRYRQTFLCICQMFSQDKVLILYYLSVRVCLYRTARYRVPCLIVHLLHVLIRTHLTESAVPVVHQVHIHNLT